MVQQSTPKPLPPTVSQSDASSHPNVAMQRAHASCDASSEREVHRMAQRARSLVQWTRLSTA
eukprot:4118952-Pleurochrysis_carterae.AAC.1